MKKLLTKFKRWCKIQWSLNNKQGKNKMSDKPKETKTKEPKKETNFKNKFVAVLHIFVYISIIYMIVLVITGTDTMTPKFFTIPAALWIAWEVGGKLIR